MSNSREDGHHVQQSLTVSHYVRLLSVEKGTFIQAEKTLQFSLTIPLVIPQGFLELDNPKYTPF